MQSSGPVFQNHRWPTHQNPEEIAAEWHSDGRSTIK
jgi:hypothetical protein